MTIRGAGSRRTIRGASSAPIRPLSPTIASMTPTTAGDAPCWRARMINTSSSATAVKLPAATASAEVRMKAWAQNQRSASVISALARPGAAPRGSCSRVCTSSRLSAETRYETASATNGQCSGEAKQQAAQRRAGERGGLAAGLVAGDRFGNLVWVHDERERGLLGDAEDDLSGTGEECDHHDLREAQIAGRDGDREAGHGERSDDVAGGHDLPPIAAVDQHSGGEVEGQHRKLVGEADESRLGR